MTSRKLWIIGPLSFLALWGLTSASKFVDPLFLPAPWDVARSLASLFLTERDIYAPAWSSLRRMLFGFVLGVGTGVPFGILLGSSPKLYATFEVLVDFLRSVPSTAFLPLFMLLFGVGDGPKVAVVVFGCFFVCVINTAAGVVHASPARLFVAQLMHASRFYTFSRVRLFEALPSIAAGIRISISYAVVLVVVSEMFIGTDVGLGRLIFDSHFTFKTARMYAVIAVAGGIGFLANKGFALAERRVLHWSGKST